MSTRWTATLRILHRPDLAPGATWFEVDSRYATTGLTHIPSGNVDLHEECLILAVGYAHEERCGRCDVSDVLDRRDQQMREVTDELWPKVQVAMVMRGRRNWWTSGPTH